MFIVFSLFIIEYFYLVTNRFVACLDRSIPRHYFDRCFHPRRPRPHLHPLHPHPNRRPRLRHHRRDYDGNCGLY